jgi:hypothetical protein
LKEGRTLEFRADLIASSGDGALARMGFTLSDGSGGYILWADKDTLALSKRPDPLQLFFLTNGLPISATNVTMVVSMAATRSSVFLQFKLLDKNQGDAVIFERYYWDTPGRDPMVVGSDDPQASYLGKTGRFRLGVYHDNASVIDPSVEIPPRSKAEVVFDNAEVLEYNSAWIAPPSTAVLLGWPENTLEEQIVVGTDSLTNSDWTPWPEPIFKRQGQLCVAVPTTALQQFFKLVPGTQFIDDFSPAPQWPYVSKDDWVPLFANSEDSTRIVCTNINGALRIRSLAPAVDGRFLLLPPGPDVVVGDFTASVDILNWPIRGREVGFLVRGTINRANLLDGSNGYIATASREQSKLVIWNGIADIPGTAFTFNSTANYRLVFSAVGPDLSLRLVNLKTGVSSEMKLKDTRWLQGPVALYLDAMAGGSLDITLDNFFVTGTKPML